jgi:hypothetical protein
MANPALEIETNYLFQPFPSWLDRGAKSVARCPSNNRSFGEL